MKNIPRYTIAAILFLILFVVGFFYNHGVSLLEWIIGESLEDLTDRWADKLNGEDSDE